MENSQNNAEQGLVALKPFRLVKFFSFTGLTVFLLFALILSWVISNNAKRVLLERSEAYALVFAGNLNHQVFQQFVLPTVLRSGEIALRNPRQFERLDTIVRNITHGLRIQSVTIFDSKQNIISYSTVTERVGKQGQGGMEYERALEGKDSSILVTNASLFNLLPGAGKMFCQLKTYIPFRQEKPFSKSTDVIMGVIEIVQDLSEDMEAILRLQGIIITTSILIMSVLFVVLRFIVARAERIIEARARERRRLEERLQQANRLASLGKMVTAVSHEIKNPLGIVHSTAEILGKRLKSVAPGNERLTDIIIEETGRLDGIVRKFLDFARPQTPKLGMVSINDVLLKLAGFLEVEGKKGGIKIATELDESLKQITADRELLHQAFLNIMLNGIQAMPEGGVLTVVSRPSSSGGKGVEVIIKDTGIGMSADTRRQIFTPFFTGKNQGTGLGLAIVKNIVANHRGEITVESSEGKGTEFKIVIPG